MKSGTPTPAPTAASRLVDKLLDEGVAVCVTVAVDAIPDTTLLEPFEPNAARSVDAPLYRSNWTAPAGSGKGSVEPFVVVWHCSLLVSYGNPQQNVPSIVSGPRNRDTPPLVSTEVSGLAVAKISLIVPRETHHPCSTADKHYSSTSHPYSQPDLCDWPSVAPLASIIHWSNRQHRCHNMRSQIAQSCTVLAYRLEYHRDNNMIGFLKSGSTQIRPKSITLLLARNETSWFDKVERGDHRSSAQHC